MDVLDKVENSSVGKPVNDVLADGYSFDLGGYLSNAFGLYGKDAGNFIGFSLVYFVVIIAISLISMLIPIPFLDNVISLFYMAPLNAGIYAYMKARKSGFEAQFGNFFDGFRNPHWMRLVLCLLVNNVVGLIIFGALVLPRIFDLGLDFFDQFSDPEAMRDPDKVMELLSMLAGSGIHWYSLLAWFLTLMITTLWVFTPLFILNRDMTFWEAMEASRKVVQKKYVYFIAFMLLITILWIIGGLLCGVGLIVTYPVYCLAKYAAYCHIMEEPLT